MLGMSSLGRMNATLLIVALVHSAPLSASEPAELEAPLNGRWFFNYLGFGEVAVTLDFDKNIIELAGPRDRLEQPLTISNAEFTADFGFGPARLKIRRDQDELHLCSLAPKPDCQLLARAK
jgi:hypothetical protein